MTDTLELGLFVAVLRITHAQTASRLLPERRQECRQLSKISLKLADTL
jgi:hypothetical protein